jgi:hypothetical protein
VQPQALPYGTTAGSFGLRGAAPAAMPGFSMATSGVDALVMSNAYPSQSAPPMSSRSGAPMFRKSIMMQESSGPIDRLEGELLAPSSAMRGRRSRAPLLFAFLLLALIAFLVWWLVL